MTESTTTAPRVNRKPRPRPARKCRVEDCLGLKVLVITETLGPKVTETNYHLGELPADFGRAFELRKFVAAGGEVYHVNLGGGPGNADACECLGHLRHGRRTVCKHVAAVKALLAAGRL